jgi:hypothetical protein
MPPRPTAKLIEIAIFILLLVLMSFPISTNAQLAQPQKYVAFRDDDVQPFVSLETLEAVNQVHIDENVPVTLGIIPHPQDGKGGNELLQDGQFLTYMRSIDSNPLFEFAQHGNTHQDIAPSPEGPSEFYGRPYAAQYNTIKQGRDDITQAFGVTATTFIPPWDNGDRNTEKAAAALGFTDYSTDFSQTDIQYGYINSMRMEGGFTIGAVNDTAFTTTIQNAQNETERFLSTPQHGDTLTFAYHAWAFTNSEGGVDSHKIQQLMNFIDWLKTEGVLFTRLDRSTVTGDSAVSPSPSAGLPVLTIGESTPPAAVSPSLSAGLPVLTIGESTPFLLVASVGIVLFAIYVSARGQRGQKNKPKDR